MKKATLALAVAEAVRFLDRAKDAQQLSLTGDKDIPAGRAAAAVKRSSLDLSFLLARLRREP